MKTDLLNTFSSELKKMPYGVPEGYFDALKKELQKSPAVTIGERGHRNRFAKYASIAAAAVILMTAGAMIMKSTLGHNDMTYEDYLVHSGAMIDEEYQEEITVIENEVNEEDIIEYLIYTGVTAELIEISK